MSVTAKTKKTKKTKKNEIVSQKPVARFYYKGGHSHPVRRTILIKEDRGDELREGNVVRSMTEAMDKVKFYFKDEIAKWGDYKNLMMTSKTCTKNPKSTTLERSSIIALFRDGA